MDEKITQPVERSEEMAALPVTGAGSSRRLLIGGGALVVLILAAAVFVGTRLLAQNQEPARGGGTQMVAEINTGSGGLRQVRINIVPARELPADEPVLDGVFARRQDDSIYVGTGDIEVRVTKEDDGTGSKKASFNGPVIEVVVTHDTQIWQDDTEELLGSGRQINGDEVTIQQVVTPGSLDELGDNTTIKVWGERRGDRVVATALVYRN